MKHLTKSVTVEGTRIVFILFIYFLDFLRTQMKQHISLQPCYHTQK